MSSSCEVNKKEGGVEEEGGEKRKQGGGVACLLLLFGLLLLFSPPFHFLPLGDCFLLLALLFSLSEASRSLCTYLDFLPAWGLPPLSSPLG